MARQFSDQDTDAAHAEMLRRIKAVQLADEPEPDHEPWSKLMDVSTYAEWQPPISLWCCDWHKVHSDGA